MHFLQAARHWLPELHACRLVREFRTDWWDTTHYNLESEQTNMSKQQKETNMKEQMWTKEYEQTNLNKQIWNQ
jgi:hypothetical protein